jgi:CubicO group peptidase (beta-lactamase class C family)
MENVAEKPWEELVRERVLTPLGMVRTTFSRSVGGSLQYRRDARGEFIRVPEYTSEHPAGSGARSTVRDLARLALMHLGSGSDQQPQVVSRRSRRRMRGDSSGPAGGGGMGWRGSAPDEYVWTMGTMPGAWASLDLHYAADSAVIVLVNSADGMQALREAVTRTLLRLPEKEATTWNTMIAIGGPTEHACAGTWQGTMHHPDGKIPIILRVLDDNSVELELGHRVLRHDETGRTRP